MFWLVPPMDSLSLGGLWCFLLTQSHGSLESQSLFLFLQRGLECKKTHPLSHWLQLHNLSGGTLPRSLVGPNEPQTAGCGR